MAPLTRRLVAALCAGAAASAGLACSQKEPPATDSKAAAVAASGPVAAPTQDQGPGAEFTDATFHLAIRPVGEYVVGVAGAAEVVLTPKGEYHCNEKYPYKLKVAESPGVRYASPVIGMDAVTLEPSRAVMRIGFTPEAPGSKTVGGLLSFSVCSDDRCLIEKRNLALAISVK